MERKEDERLNTEKNAPNAASKKTRKKRDELKPRRMESRLWIFTGIFAIASIAIGCIVWFMPAKVDKVVEDFDIGRRSAQFEQVPELLKRVPTGGTPTKNVEIP